jgi:hypothetical protein
MLIPLQERPQHLQPRVLLLRNLMRQAREGDVPALALQALHESGQWHKHQHRAGCVDASMQLDMQHCQGCWAGA